MLPGGDKAACIECGAVYSGAKAKAALLEAGITPPSAPPSTPTPAGAAKAGNGNGAGGRSPPAKGGKGKQEAHAAGDKARTALEKELAAVKAELKAYQEPGEASAAPDADAAADADEPEVIAARRTLDLAHKELKFLR